MRPASSLMCTRWFASAGRASAIANGDWDVRAAAADAAGRLGLAGLAAPLSALMDDEAWTVRYAAANALRSFGQPGERLLRDIAAGKETTGDTTTLEDYSVLAKLRQDEE